MGLILGSGRPLEEEMAPYSSILAWKTPRAEEPGELQDTGHRVRQNCTHRHTEPSGHDSGMYISMYIHILFSRLFSLIGHYKILSIVPYAIWLDGQS